MPKLSVLKFGGSSLATPEHIRAVAKKISELHHAGRQLIIVTSAMGKTTDQLTELAYKVSPQPHRRELDMLLSTGERISMALMSMALQDLGCPSISFTGSQAGIMTDGSFSNALIREIKPIRVEESLRENKVVVLAGFQGVDPVTKEITTLGRGGSDTTAVAMAGHFGAERCEILKDVDGVYSADPAIVKNAWLYQTLPVDKLYEMCFWGAKVLNYRSVAWARDHRVPLFVGRADDFSIGTSITAMGSEVAVARTKGSTTEPIGDDPSLTASPGRSLLASTGSPLLAVNSHAQVIQLDISCTDKNEGLTTLKNIFDERGLPEPQILQESDHTSKEGSYQVLLTCAADVLSQARVFLPYSSKIKIQRDHLATVTATYRYRPSETFVVSECERVTTIQNFFK